MTRSSAIERFEAKYIPVPEAGCWLWTAGCDEDGYGQFTLDPSQDRKPQGAHRASWRLYRGPIPAGLLVLHSCDVPACVNPYHLFLGTQADNLADQQRKGRAAGKPPLKEFCGYGHLMEGDNVGWRLQPKAGYKSPTRFCRKCNNDRKRRARFPSASTRSSVFCSNS